MDEEQWMAYIAGEIGQVSRPAFVNDKTISAVPPTLLEVRPRSYCPRIVTVGPLYKKLEPCPLDTCKALCIKEFMHRRNIQLDELIAHTMPNPDTYQNIYCGLSKYNSEALKRLLIVDTVFIHEFLFFMRKGFRPDSEFCGYLYSFFNNPLTRLEVMRDLLLIGNQVPMSFLKSLTELPSTTDVLEFPPEDMNTCLKSLIWRYNPFCSSHLRSKSYIKDMNEFRKSYIKDMNGFMRDVSPLDNYEHFLDCLYHVCVQSANGEGHQKFTGLLPYRLPTASMLIKVGIKFKAKIGNTSAIKYRKKGLVMELPKLVVVDETEDILRNLLAYELTSMQVGEICGYAIIMDSLIDTTEDLRILYRAGVLENHLGSDERLLRMWNDMCSKMIENTCKEWEEMIEDIVKHYESNWRVMYVEFCSKFFSRPWLWLSTIAAVVLIASSILQVIYTILPYYLPAH